MLIECVQGIDTCIATERPFVGRGYDKHSVPHRRLLVCRQGHGLGDCWRDENQFSSLGRSDTFIWPPRASSIAGYCTPRGYLSPRSKSISRPNNGQGVATYEIGSPSLSGRSKLEQTIPHKEPNSSNTGSPLIPPSNRLLTR